MFDCPDPECPGIPSTCCFDDVHSSHQSYSSFQSSRSVLSNHSSSGGGRIPDPDEVTMYSRLSTSLGLQQERNCCENMLFFCETELCLYCPSLSWTQRIYGCIICAALGFLISMGSFSKFAQLIGGNAIPFVAQYTFGSILSISSTCFLYGPISQAKTMMASTRIASTIVYFSLMIITILSAFVLKPPIIVMLLLIIAQYLAFTWYTLSLFPWGREIVKSCFISYCCSCVTAEEWAECFGEPDDEVSITTG